VSAHPVFGASGRLFEMCWTYARAPMCVVDCQTGLFVEINPAAEQFSGYSRAELIGKHLSYLHPPFDHHHLAEALQRSQQDPSLAMHFNLRRKDGRHIPVDFSSSDLFEQDGRLLMVGILNDLRDIEEQARLLDIKKWALQAYAATASALGVAQSSQSLIQEICEAITRTSPFVLAVVGIADNNPEKSVRLAGLAGSAQGYLEGLELSWSEQRLAGSGPIGVALRTGSRQVIENTQTDQAFNMWRERARQAGICSVLSLPFLIEDGPCAVLTVYSSRCSAFGPVVVDAFTHLAKEIGVGLHNLSQRECLLAERLKTERAQQQLAAASSKIVGVIAKTIELRDRYSDGQLGRVAEIAVSIATQVGLADHRLQALQLAAQIHDIGSITIPIEILTRTGRLKPAERALIQMHIETGTTVLADVPFHSPVTEVLRQHHEWMDGTGYPYGLKGKDILTEARILAVAEIVEAYAAPRPFRAVFGVDVALGAIQDAAGKHLDPEVVRICVDLFREKGFALATSGLR